MGWEYLRFINEFLCFYVQYNFVEGAKVLKRYSHIGSTRKVIDDRECNKKYAIKQRMPAVEHPQWICNYARIDKHDNTVDAVF